MERIPTATQAAVKRDHACGFSPASIAKYRKMPIDHVRASLGGRCRVQPPRHVSYESLHKTGLGLMKAALVSGGTAAVRAGGEHDLLVAVTEKRSRQEMDRFADALRSVVSEEG